MPEAAPQGLPEITDSARQILTLLLRHGPMPRTELARRLLLTPAALTKSTRPLIEIGLLEETTTEERGGPGRPVMPLAINPAWGRFVGVKLTGEGVHGVLTNLAGTVLNTVQTPLDSTDVTAICDLIVQQINHLADGVSLTGLGVSLAGAVVHSSGQVISSPFLGWRDVALADQLAQRCNEPVSVENDLRALTTAQHWFDDAAASFALVTFGAGVGCGLVLQDRVVAGHGGASGVVGHLRIRDQGPPCHWGHRGCVSGYATTSAILDAVREHAGTVSLSEVAELARHGDRVARSVLADAGYAVGCLIGTICNVTGPEKVILSGEGAELFDVIDAAVHRGIDEVVHPELPPIALVVKTLSFEDWARGAAVVAIQDHLTRSAR